MATRYETKTLIQGTQKLNVSSIQHQMYEAEAHQPEGTRMRLVLNLQLPKWQFVQWVNPAEHTAAAINTACRLKGVKPWPGATTYATAKGTNEIDVQWEKGNIFVVIVLSAVLGAIIYWAITHWSLQKVSVLSGGGTATVANSPSLLGTANLWAWALIGVGGFAVVRQYMAYREDLIDHER